MPRRCRSPRARAATSRDASLTGRSNSTRRHVRGEGPGRERGSRRGTRRRSRCRCRLSDAGAFEGAASIAAGCSTRAASHVGLASGAGVGAHAATSQAAPSHAATSPAKGRIAAVSRILAPPNGSNLATKGHDQGPMVGLRQGPKQHSGALGRCLVAPTSVVGRLPIGRLPLQYDEGPSTFAPRHSVHQ
jgi:hypothetical protein